MGAKGHRVVRQTKHKGRASETKHRQEHHTPSKQQKVSDAKRGGRHKLQAAIASKQTEATGMITRPRHVCENQQNHTRHLKDPCKSSIQVFIHKSDSKDSFKFKLRGGKEWSRAWPIAAATLAS